jgi:hypothetical protein
MSRSWRRPWPPWIPAAAVGAVVLLVGARLVTLSAGEHATELRGAAQDVVEHHAHLIGLQLQALLERAREESRGRRSMPSG